MSFALGTNPDDTTDRVDVVAQTTAFACRPSDINAHYAGRTLSNLEKSAVWSMYVHSNPSCIYGDTSVGLNQFAKEQVAAIVDGSVDPIAAVIP